MCGFLLTDGLSVPFHHGLLGGLRRRGPDGVGFWTCGLTNVAHARLAVVGLDDRGVQPLENDTHVLAFNGEIYNFLDLARRLSAEGGAQVELSSDAAVLLEGWTRWGPRILSEMTGFWAFAIFDKRARKVTLCRDQIGVRPLYYGVVGGGFAASSLLGPLLDAIGVGQELDFDALSEYVRYQFTFGDKTFLRGVKKVLPGQIVEYASDTNSVSVSTYEDIWKKTASEPITNVWVERTRDLLVRCCGESTLSDTPFTSTCSGGLDSSAVTRITSPEVAYHGNYSDPDCNETVYARQAVADTHTRLFVVNAREKFDLVSALDSIVDDLDELTIGSVVLPLDDLFGQVKRRFKVVLTGAGGDELFAGYTRYELALGRCTHEAYRPLFERMTGIDSVASRFELTHVKGSPSFYKFYTPAAKDRFYEAFTTAGDDELGQMLSFDRRHFLAGLLNIDDKMAGRHSLEARPSLLHQDFVRHVVRASEGDMLAAGLKNVWRKVLHGVVPDTILAREDKLGFTTPIGTFVNRSAHLIRERLSSSRFRDLYDMRRVRFTADTKFSREVFGLLLLDLWLHKYAARG